MNPRFTHVAALLPILACAPVFAQQSTALDAVIVTANRQPQRVSEVLADVTVIDRQALEMAGQSTLEELLARQPGLEFAANGSQGAVSNLFIRGTNAGHVLFLVDGVRVGSATSGNVLWSRLPLSQIERVEILRGPASSLYGSEAIGGVVQIFTRQGQDGLRVTAEAGYGSFNTQSLNAAVSGAQEAWRYALGLSRYETKGFNSKPWDSKANPDRDGFKHDSVTGQLSYAFPKGHELGLSFFHDEGENRYDSSGVANDWVNETSLTAYNLSLRNALTEHWHSTVTLGNSTDKQVALKDRAFSSLFQTEQRQYAWQNDIRSGLGSFLLGAERLEQSVTTSSKYSVTERTNDSFLAGWSQSLGDHRLQVNARYDDNSQFGEKTTGSAAYGYRFSPNWRANMSYGTAFKAPTFNDLYYPKSGTSVYVGNPALKPESARNREATLHYEQGLQHISLTWYLNQVENLIVWPKAGTVIMPSNVSNARLEGVTLAYEGELFGYNAQASYDYLDAVDANSGYRLIRRPQNSAKFSIGRQSGAWEWRVEQQVSAHRFDNEANTVRMGGYALTNVYGAYHLDKAWSVFARVNNVFDRDYVLAEGYATAGLNAFLGIRYAPK